MLSQKVILIVGLAIVLVGLLFGARMRSTALLLESGDLRAQALNQRVQVLKAFQQRNSDLMRIYAQNPESAKNISTLIAGMESANPQNQSEYAEFSKRERSIETVAEGLIAAPMEEQKGPFLDALKNSEMILRASIKAYNKTVEEHNADVHSPWLAYGKPPPTLPKF